MPSSWPNRRSSACWSVLPARHAGGLGRSRRPAGRPDGQLRGRAHQPRSRAHRLPGPHAHRQGHQRRTIFATRGAARRRADRAPRRQGTRCTCSGCCPMAACTATRRTCTRCFALAKAMGAPKVFVHVITDGRDTSPNGGRGYVAELEAALAATGARIASVSGRYYAMDRDKRWERVKLAYDAIVSGTAPFGSSAAARDRGGVREERHRRVHPAARDRRRRRASRSARWRDGDSVIFFNFRADRARQIIRALMFDDFDGFPTPRRSAGRS